jgi:catechol 2,3-dioxygenase-like lactoylglutathione lyase family enzyme
MSNEWYARPVLFVADIDRSVDFYVKQLGFTQNWRYEEAGKAWVAQVARPGCELILDGNGQWPDKVGKGRMATGECGRELRTCEANLSN